MDGRSQQRDSRTGTVARGPGVAGAALKGRVEVVDGFLKNLPLTPLACIQLRDGGQDLLPGTVRLNTQLLQVAVGEREEGFHVHLLLLEDGLVLLK